jgi:hypothetical protein
MISYTLSIQLFTLKTLEKKILSIEIMIFLSFGGIIGKNIRHRKLPQQKFEKRSLINYETVFLFTSGTYGSGEDLTIFSGLRVTLKCRSRSNHTMEF